MFLFLMKIRKGKRKGGKGLAQGKFNRKIGGEEALGMMKKEKNQGKVCNLVGSLWAEIKRKGKNLRRVGMQGLKETSCIALQRASGRRIGRKVKKKSLRKTGGLLKIRKGAALTISLRKEKNRKDFLRGGLIKKGSIGGGAGKAVNEEETTKTGKEEKNTRTQHVQKRSNNKKKKKYTRKGQIRK